MPYKPYDKENIAMLSEPDIDLDALRDELIYLSDFRRRKYWICKRIFDIFFSSSVLLLGSPIFLGLAAAIWLDDPHGSPIYAQTRVGRHEKEFKFYKFRSMIVGADKMLDELQELNEKDGPVFKIKNDPRITRIGHFIRRTSLDELPQFWNVLKGDMTIVGPRPPLPEEVAQYNRYHRLRQLVTPGLTCYWQTCDNRDSVTFDEWITMDIQYIKDRNFLVDLKLILRTIKVMFTSQGE